MKPKWIVALILVVISLAAYIYFFTGKPYENRSTAAPVIKVADNVFDVTVDECIDLLNQEIARENLNQIPKDYETVEHDGWTTYKAMINKNLMIRFVTYDKEGQGIVRIGLSALESFGYQEGDKEVNKTISKTERKESQKYYEIICRLVRPNFNAKTFIKSAEIGSIEFNLDGIIFLSNSPSFSSSLFESGDIWGNESIRVYEAISSKTLYEKYGERITYDDDIYLNSFLGASKADVDIMLQSTDNEQTVITDNSLPMLISFAVTWLITLIAAFYFAIRERKEERKVAMVWKVILVGQIIWIAISMVQIFIFFNFLDISFIQTWLSTGFFSSGAMVGIIGNTALIYYLKNNTKRLKA